MRNKIKIKGVTLFKKLFKWLAIIIAIIAIIFLLCAALVYLGVVTGAGIAGFIPALGFMATWGTAEFIIAGAIGLAVAFAIDGDAAGDVVAKAGAVASSAAKAVTKAVGSVASSVASSIFSNPWVIAFCGVGVYLLVKED